MGEGVEVILVRVASLVGLGEPTATLEREEQPKEKGRIIHLSLRSFMSLLINNLVVQSTDYRLR